MVLGCDSQSFCVVFMLLCLSLPVSLPPFSLTCSFPLCVSVVMGMATGSCCSRQMHLQFIRSSPPGTFQHSSARLFRHVRWLYLHSLKPQCFFSSVFLVTASYVFWAPVIANVFLWQDTVSCSCFSLSPFADPSASLCLAHCFICSSGIPSFVINKHLWTDLRLQSLHLGPTKILSPNRNLKFEHYPWFAEMFTANIYSGEIVGHAVWFKLFFVIRVTFDLNTPGVSFSVTHNCSAVYRYWLIKITDLFTVLIFLCESPHVFLLWVWYIIYSDHFAKKNELLITKI